MERLEFFGSAVFVPVFLVSIGLLLDPSVMFKGETLSLAAYICAAALGGKAIACWLAGSLLSFSWPERAAMYVLTVPQAAATLAVTLIGFEIGLFGTTVVNAVLVLILVSIVAAALLTEKVIEWRPARPAGAPPLGSKILVITPSTGPTDAAIRASTSLARPDGGHSDLLITRSGTERPLDADHLREIGQRVFRQGFDGRVHTEVDELAHAVSKALLAGGHSLVIVDEPTFDAAPNGAPLLVIDGGTSTPQAVLLLDGAGEPDGLADEIGRRLAQGERGNRFFRRFSGSAAEGGLTVRSASEARGPAPTKSAGRESAPL